MRYAKSPYPLRGYGASGGWAKPYLSRPTLSPVGLEAPSWGAVGALKRNRIRFLHLMEGAI
ncbi:hypothetical protein [Pedobacter psychroterrae]|uniref:Uncharacterized protein n=1 Tax=Pedobacter psychroterrae TaxID=2530453 RepID=A0A4R0NNG0_9SPHI|nr:hypothetical protein [Pedobacter psychroterrae]TCD01488.1 hypothetical protein EZ437_12180 [Pedobacter psychroterrae]